MRDIYMRAAPEPPATLWLHYRQIEGGWQLIGAQPYGDFSPIYFMVAGEAQRYSRAIQAATKVVADNEVQAWRDRIDVELHKAPGTYTQLPPNLRSMTDSELEDVAQQFGMVQRARYLRERAAHMVEWEALYGPVDPTRVLATAARWIGRPEADETWWERAHNGAPEMRVA